MTTDDGSQVLRLVCTDRGRHPERAVGLVWEDQGLQGTPTPTRPGRAPLVPSWRASSDQGLALAPCPTCGRDVRLGGERVRALWEAGVHRVDVSLLP